MNTWVKASVGRSLSDTGKKTAILLSLQSLTNFPPLSMAKKVWESGVPTENAMIKTPSSPDTFSKPVAPICTLAQATGGKSLVPPTAESVPLTVSFPSWGGSPATNVRTAIAFTRSEQPRVGNEG